MESTAVEEQLVEPQLEVNAFKAAEKRLQLHKDQVLVQGRGGRRRAKGFVVRPTDLSGLMDLQPGPAQPPGVTYLGVPSGMPPTAAAFSFAAHPGGRGLCVWGQSRVGSCHKMMLQRLSHPPLALPPAVVRLPTHRPSASLPTGLLLVRGALPPELQRRLVVEALTRYIEPPAHTTLMRAHQEGLPGIWAAAQQGLRLQPQRQAGSDAPASSANGGSQHANSSIWGPGGSGPTAQSLLRRVRWATLGPPYDWTRRVYLRGAPHVPLPPDLRQLALALAALAAQLLPAGEAPSQGGAAGGGAANGGAVAAVGVAEAAAGAAEAAAGPPEAAAAVRAASLPRFNPDAALVNFFYEGAVLL